MRTLQMMDGRAATAGSWGCVGAMALVSILVAAVPSAVRAARALSDPHGAWELVITSVSPPGVQQPDAAFDLHTRSMVLSDNTCCYLWDLALAGPPDWEQETIPAPGINANVDRTRVVYDPVRQRFLFVSFFRTAWYRPDEPHLYQASVAGSPSAGEIAMNVSGAPSPLHLRDAVYDPVRDRLLVIGLAGESNTPTLWSVSLTGTPHWEPLAASGAPPSSGRNLVYDPGRDRLIVMGSGAMGALSLSGAPAWSVLTPAGVPPPFRYSYQAVYDSRRDRVVFFGGSYQDLQTTWHYLNDTWTLNLGNTSWQALAPESPPSARDLHAAIYDRAGDRMVIFGGDIPSLTNDTWALQWDSPATAGAIDATPGILDFGPVAIAATQTRTFVVTNLGVAALVVSGMTSSDPSVTASPSAFTLAPAESREVTVQWAPGAPQDLGTSLLIESDDPDFQFRSVQLQGDVVTDPTSVDGGLAGGFGLRLVGSNPARRAARLELSIARPGPAAVELFDARGTRVRTLFRGELAAGRFPLVWDGMDGDGRLAGAGVYLARATSLEGTARVKIALVR